MPRSTESRANVTKQEAAIFLELAEALESLIGAQSDPPRNEPAATAWREAMDKSLAALDRAKKELLT